jgi:hypothetical protein
MGLALTDGLTPQVLTRVLSMAMHASQIVLTHACFIAGLATGQGRLQIVVQGATEHQPSGRQADQCGEREQLVTLLSQGRQVLSLGSTRVDLTLQVDEP